MTKAQYAVYNRLAKKQVNKRDVTIVEESSTSVTFHLVFPGLYLTYDSVGHLLLSETAVERVSGSKRLHVAGQAEAPSSSEMGSIQYRPPVVDDDLPF